MYSKAPISELIFGMIFNSDILIKNGILFELVTELFTTYDEISVLPSIVEEELIGYKIFQNQNIHDSGFQLYRLISRKKILLFKFNITYLL